VPDGDDGRNGRRHDGDGHGWTHGVRHRGTHGHADAAEPQHGAEERAPAAPRDHAQRARDARAQEQVRGEHDAGHPGQVT